jgi:hypothetical protein
MTSPVERISGPSSVSTPGKRAKGNTASLTRDVVAHGLGALRPKLFQALAGHDARGDLGDGRPMVLATKGTVRDARGFTSST